MVDAIVSNPGGASTPQRIATPEKSNQVKIAALEPQAQERRRRRPGGHSQ